LVWSKVSIFGISSSHKRYFLGFLFINLEEGFASGGADVPKIIGKPMNRDEAFKILNFNENTNPTPAEIMKRFEKMYIDNTFLYMKI